MQYFSVHFKKKNKSRGFIAMRMASNEPEGRKAAEHAGWGTLYFADMTTFKEVTKSKYEKWFNKNFPDKNLPL